jgi:hypothetical protein
VYKVIGETVAILLRYPVEDDAELLIPLSFRFDPVAAVIKILDKP